jgi:hypothetical protein
MILKNDTNNKKDVILGVFENVQDQENETLEISIAPIHLEKI